MPAGLQNIIKLKSLHYCSADIKMGSCKNVAQKLWCVNILINEGDILK